MVCKVLLKNEELHYVDLKNHNRGYVAMCGKKLKFSEIVGFTPHDFCGYEMCEGCKMEALNKEIEQ